MSFKNKLVLFFLIIVVLPMTATTILIVNASSEIDRTKTSGYISSVIDVASMSYKEDRETAVRRAERLVLDRKFRIVWGKTKSSKLIQNYLKTKINRSGISSVSGYDAKENLLFRIGEKNTIGSIRVSGPGSVRYLDIGKTSPTRLVHLFKKRTGADFLIKKNGQVVASSLGKNDLVTDYDQQSFDINYYQKEGGVKKLEVIALVLKSKESGISDRPLLIAVFLGLFAVAVLAAFLLQKSMRQQIINITESTKKMAGGKFDEPVEVGGADELTALGSEINKMREQIKTQIETLSEQGERLEKTFSLLGETMSSTLNRTKLLNVTAETALELSKADHACLDYKGQAIILKPEKNQERATKLLKKAKLRLLSDNEKVDGFYTCQKDIKEQGTREVIASLYLFKQSVFSPREIEIIDSVALSASLSLNNISLHEQVVQMAKTDGLTGLLTKNEINLVLEKELKRSERFKNSMSVAILDIDDFKKLNDDYGHLTGDRILKRVTEIMQSEIRDIDEIGRFGGEEFVFVFPETTSDRACLILERIRKKIEDEQFLEKGSVTVSIGVSESILKDTTRSLFQRADSALYLAKKTGKNRIQKDSDLK